MKRRYIHILCMMLTIVLVAATSCGMRDQKGAKKKRVSMGWL